VFEANWNQVIEDFEIPHGMVVQLGEISGGSNTPKMVSKLLQWKKENLDQCESYWNRLYDLQSRLLNGFSKLSQIDKRDRKAYEDELRECAQYVIGRQKSGSPVASVLLTIQETYNVWLD
jgi:phosphomevalonate kinase